jgi:4-aminobutyrate aminotransferase-like enzyme
VVRLLPPLTFGDAEAKLLVDSLSALIREYLSA